MEKNNFDSYPLLYYKKLRGIVGVPLNYVNKPCVNCKRVRVEVYPNGKEICEKCSYDQETKKIDFAHWELHN